MAKEAVNEESQENIKVANVGDMIEVKTGLFKGKRGEVVLVRENSVIIKTGINPKTGEPMKTVVNHKNYKKMK